MKTNNLTDCHVNELTTEETSLINGGESLWYWIAYGIGSFGNAMTTYPQMPYSGAVH